MCNYGVFQPTTIREDMTHYDKMAAIAHRKFNDLLRVSPDYLPGRKVMASFILKRGE